MLKAKTNEDFNNQKPNPSDPNQTKNKLDSGKNKTENKSSKTQNSFLSKSKK